MNPERRMREKASNSKSTQIKAGYQFLQVLLANFLLLNWKGSTKLHSPQTAAAVAEGGVQAPA